MWPLPEKSIHGEIALITGAGHGMGRLFALKLASLGAKVIVNLLLFWFACLWSEMKYCNILLL